MTPSTAARQYKLADLDARPFCISYIAGDMDRVISRWLPGRLP